MKRLMYFRIESNREFDTDNIFGYILKNYVK